jgi:hypothetical protein
MEAGAAAGARDFDLLPKHSIELRGVLFHSITHTAVD